VDLRRLQYFVAVADAGSFSVAAATLHLAQSTLSGHVLALEKELGQALLVRHGRGAEPTESGRALLAHARAIFELTERARSDMLDRQASPRGQVTVGLPPHVALRLSADIVSGFRQQYPNAMVCIEEALSIRLREWLLAGRLDMALLFDPPASPLLHLETVVRESLVVFSTAPLPAQMRLADVAKLPLVLPRAPNAIRQLLESHVAPRRLALGVVAEVDSIQTVLSIVARGAACTVLPASSVQFWQHAVRLHTAAIHAPAIRNRLVLAAPLAEPAMKMTDFTLKLLRRLGSTMARARP
jgi:LysR family nitrogen assimilation transcriptional regulator